MPISLFDRRLKGVPDRDIIMPSADFLPDESENSPFARAIIGYRLNPDNIGYTAICDHVIEPYIERKPRPESEKQPLDAATLREAEELLDHMENHGESTDIAAIRLSSRAGQSEILKAIDLAELAYARGIVFKLTTPGANNLKAQMRLEEMRYALADMYAHYEVTHMTSAQKAGKSDTEWLEKKTQKYDDYLRGTLSAYLLNMLIAQKMVPENTRFSAIVPNKPLVPREELEKEPPVRGL